MSVPSQSHSPAQGARVRVSMVVRDSRGFTHFYEELESTPDAVRDAYDSMARATSVTPRPNESVVPVDTVSAARRGVLTSLVEMRSVAREVVVGAAVPMPLSGLTGEPVVLRVKHVEWAIALYRSGELDEVELQEWAEAVHSAHEVSLDARNDELLSQALFELSTPVLFGTMPEIVESLSVRLRLGNAP